MDFSGGARKAGARRIHGHAGGSLRAKRALINSALDQKSHYGDRPIDELEARYPHAIQFYDSPPASNIALAEFESLALERLKVLRAIEKVSSLSILKYSNEWVEKVDHELRHSNSGLSAFSYHGLERAPEKLLNREKDHFSHFILRFAFCKTEDLRRWFVSQEYDLFRYRCISAGCLKEFIEINELNYPVVPDEEFRELQWTLTSLANRGQSGMPTPSTFYKVPFTEALDLVRGRKVLLRGGMCYVPDTEMLSLVSWIFKSMLTQSLVMTYKILPNLDEDDRVLKLLSNMDKRYTGADYSAQEGEESVKPEMIPELSEKHFPLCMRAMQSTLKSAHHLKYKARLQYGLFLKGIGLSLDDAIRFFRGEFTHSHVDPEKFDKEYVYGIRYNYGKEGKKVNWTPWSCMKIIMENVGPGENHGCPYRHHDPNVLRELLVKRGIEGENLREIMELAKDGHYQKACALEFKSSHMGSELSTGTMTNHPNQYYMESVKGGLGSSASKSGPKVKTERAHLYERTD